MSYGRFFAMIATSTVVMFGLMYLNTYLWTHVFWSETRTYMALLMGATMAIIMLGFMLSMYSSKMANAAIFIGAHGQGSKVSDAVLDGDDFDLVLGVRDDPKRADIIFNIQRHRIMPRGRVSR